MKRKAIEQVPVRMTRKKSGIVVTAQELEEILILNVFNGGKLKGRYCINTKTGEYTVFHAYDSICIWGKEKLRSVLTGSYYWYYPTIRKVRTEGEEDSRLICEKLKLKRDLDRKYCTVWNEIDRRETSYNDEIRERAEERRMMRVDALMKQIPKPPEELKDWIFNLTGGKDFAFYDKDNDNYAFTCCKGKRRRLKGRKHNEEVTCPYCKKKVIVKKRNQSIRQEEKVLVIQPGAGTGVMRYFNLAIYWGIYGREMEAEERVRILLDGRRKPVFYEQYGYFDIKSNPQNRRDYGRVTWLYDAGIEEALKGTLYETWAPLLKMMHGHRSTYNSWLYEPTSGYYRHGLIEYLLKGRFYRLLEEYNWWRWEHTINATGKTIEEVFKIKDRQRINRIRENDGGILYVKWMQWSDRHKAKISEKAMEWLVRNDVTPDAKYLLLYFSPESAMNYIERQRKESYPGMSVERIIDQYENYIGMCKELRKKCSDEMIYKPRELKRRHDEAVLECEQRKAELEASKYAEKFPEAETVLKEIREDFEYKGDTYRIVVPRHVVDIVLEGRALHHCAGATDRYFDRIAQHETYIVFLRENKDPEKPFYTVEVEPGGTIRQHRGAYDEEPGIEKIKPFLRMWQKEIKRRMNDAAKERARISAIKREKNIEELKEKNNTRVLKGLMEDFMEAM